MVRLMFKSLMVVVFVVFIGNYIIYLKTGQMPLRDMQQRSGDDWLVDLREMLSPSQLTEDAKKLVDDVTGEGATAKVYKWTDANGQVHFGDAPKSDNAQQLEVDVRNTIASPGTITNVSAEPGATAGAEQTPLEKARAAVEAMEARIQQQEQQTQDN